MMEERIPFYKQYQKIMDGFDFEHIHNYMCWSGSKREYDNDGKCVGTSTWKVYLDNGDFRVPTIQELKDMATYLLFEVSEKYLTSSESFYSVRTGPFMVSCYNGMLELDCVIESWGGSDLLC